MISAHETDMNLVTPADIWPNARDSEDLPHPEGPCTRMPSWRGRKKRKHTKMNRHQRVFILCIFTWTRSNIESRYNVIVWWFSVSKKWLNRSGIQWLQDILISIHRYRGRCRQISHIVLWCRQHHSARLHLIQYLQYFRCTDFKVFSLTACNGWWWVMRRVVQIANGR